MEITKCQALLLDSKYSKLSVGEASSIVGESKYDNLKIDNINNLVLENGYTTVTIRQLTKKLTYNGSYGSFSIDRVPAGFESVDLETHYMGVRIGIDESASYKLEAKVTYGSLKYNEDNFKNQRRIVENNSNEVSGTVGKEESPTAKVNVLASYGSVKLY
jgi:predicted PolB exonuclease-like 3'-5' exonuclease